MEINDTFGLYIEWIIRLTPPKRWEREIYEITSKSDRQFNEGRGGRVFPFYKFNENYDFIKEQEGREIVPIAGARNRFLIKKIADIFIKVRRADSRGEIERG